MFFPIVYSFFLCYIFVDYISMGLFLSHWSMDMLLWQYNNVSTTLVYSLSWNQGAYFQLCSLSRLFWLFLKTFECLHNFSITCSSSEKFQWYFDRDCRSLLITLCCMVIFNNINVYNLWVHCNLPFFSKSSISFINILQFPKHRSFPSLVRCIPILIDTTVNRIVFFLSLSDSALLVCRNM